MQPLASRWAFKALGHIKDTGNILLSYARASRQARPDYAFEAFYEVWLKGKNPKLTVSSSKKV
jgi:hypothetical protein